MTRSSYSKASVQKRTLGGECWGTPGHDLGDSSGQHWSPMDRSDRPLTCANAITLDPAGRHAVYGMPEIRPPCLRASEWGRLDTV
jgi:hypothetical protein